MSRVKGAEMPRKLEVRRGMLEDGELNRLLLNEKSLKYLTIWLWMCDCGLRVGEVLKLRVEEVFNWLDDAPNEVTTQEDIRIIGKRNKVRMVHPTKRLREALLQYWADCEQGGHMLALRILLYSVGARVIERTFKRRLLEVGIRREYLCPHSLRHTYATRLLRAGIDPMTVSISLGHTSLQTTMGYLHTNPDLLRRVSFALEEKQNG